MFDVLLLYFVLCTNLWGNLWGRGSRGLFHAKTFAKINSPSFGNLLSGIDPLRIDFLEHQTLLSTYIGTLYLFFFD